MSPKGRVISMVILLGGFACCIAAMFDTSFEMWGVGKGKRYPHEISIGDRRTLLYGQTMMKPLFWVGVISVGSAVIWRIASIRFVKSENITDEILESLGRTKRSQPWFLTLAGSKVTDAGVGSLKERGPLKGLCLQDTGITGKGLVYLEGLTNLTDLDLANSMVSDSQLDSLGGLTNLKELSVANNQISDLGLIHLARLGDLELLNLSDTNVTDAGVADLQKALPNCKIIK